MDCYFLVKLHAFNGPIDSIHSFDLFTVYTTLPHNLCKQSKIYLIKWSFGRSGGNLFAATQIKPLSLMRNVNMLDIHTGGVTR